jgi:predicted methyltransferase
MRCFLIPIGLALSGLFLSGCAAVPVASDPLAGQRLSAPPTDYSALLSHPDRPREDFKDDASRKPDQVLQFVGLDYGMTIVEIEAAGGYYTELLSHAVGAEGKVYMQNPVYLDGIFGEAISARLDDRLDNVQVLRADFDTLAVADMSADLVTWFLGPHDLWYQPDGAPEEAFGNPDRAFAEIARVLKPGGAFVVMDHAAPSGTPAQSGNETHRIDPVLVKQLAQNAGLTLVQTSDLLANPEDDGTISVFDPELRRNTNRFILKFRK